MEGNKITFKSIDEYILQFEKLLPYELISKIVKFRVAENVKQGR